jgi:hypothetical protein
VPAIYQSLAQIDSVVRFHRTQGAVEDVVLVMGVLKEKQRNLSLDLRESKNIVVKTKKKSDAVKFPFWACYESSYIVSNEIDSDCIPEAYFIYLEVSSP